MSATPEPGPPPPPLYPPPPAPRKQRSALRIVLIVVASVIVLGIALIGGLVLLVNNSTGDAQKVSDQLVTAVQAGDGKAAYALTGPSFRAATTEAQLTELVQRLSSLVKKDKRSPDGKSINASTDSGKIAVFTYTMNGTSGSPVYFKTQIRDEDGRWVVMNFRSSETELDTDVE